MSRRIRLTVAYDGTRYHGWQLQPQAVTVEGVLNEHLSALLGEQIQVTGASRTDAGVHALCNVAVFDTNARIPGEKVSYALNQRLPQDVRIRGSEEVPDTFHPRKSASRKTYEYRINNEEFPDPLKRLYTYFTYRSLDVERMREAAACLVGEHDFRSFCNPATEAETTVRTIYSLEVLRKGSDIVIQVCGNGFLYNMVRIIAGTLLEAGKGKCPPEKMRRILESRDRRAAGPTAPACGLCLTGLEYEEKPGIG